MIIVIQSLKGAWGAINFICANPIIQRIGTLLGLKISSDGTPDYTFGHDQGVKGMAEIKAVEAKFASALDVAYPPLGDGVVYCPNASMPSKEWPHWHRLPAATMAGSWHPDLVDAVISAHTVVANHSGPAHLAVLLKRRVIVLTNRDWHIDPPNATVLGSDLGWPTLDSVLAALAIPRTVLL